MSRCPHCRIYYREPDDEPGQHPCPSCGIGPGDEPDEDEEDDDCWDDTDEDSDWDFHEDEDSDLDDDEEDATDLEWRMDAAYAAADKLADDLEAAGF